MKITFTQRLKRRLNSENTFCDLFQDILSLAFFIPKSEDCNTQIEQSQVFTPKKLEIKAEFWFDKVGCFFQECLKCNYIQNGEV